MRPGLSRYVKAAFNARPAGMLVAPNWVGLAAFAMLGFLDWGFWILGAGLELAYLFVLTENRGFQALVDGRGAHAALASWQARVEDALRRVDAGGQGRYERLRARCRLLLDEHPGDAAAHSVQRDTLERLLWLFVKLLRTRQSLLALLDEAKAQGQDEEGLAERIAELRKDLGEGPDSDLRTSISTQIDLLQQRAARQAEAERRLAHVDLELERIEQQVELFREETALAASSGSAGARIEVLSSGLNEAMSWLRAQEDLAEPFEEMSDAAPPLLGGASQSASSSRR